MVVRVSPLLRASLRKGLEAVVHLLRAASVLAFAWLAFVAIAVDDVVHTMAEDVLWRVRVPGFDALSAASGAIRKVIGCLLTHDQLVTVGIGLRVRYGVHTRLLLPREVADLGF